MNRYGAFASLAKFALILVSIVVAQGILSLYFRVFSYFDLPLIYTIYYGFTLASPTGSIAIGSALGLMQDSLSGAILGLNGFSKTLIGFLAALVGLRFDVDQPIVRVLALVLFTFVDGVLRISLAAVVNPGDQSLALGQGTWVLSATFNTLFGLVLFGYGSQSDDPTT